MPERRPRIPSELADRIDRRRGSVPFERYVREVLTATLDDIEQHVREVARERGTLGAALEKMDGSAQASKAGIGRQQPETFGSRVATPPRAPEPEVVGVACTFERCSWTAGPGFVGNKCPQCRSPLKAVSAP